MSGLKVLGIIISLSGAGIVFALIGVSHAIDRETIALQQISDATTEISERMRDAPPSDLNGECHQTLALFDEWLKHDLKSGGSGRKQ